MRYLPGTILTHRIYKNDKIEVLKATPCSKWYTIKRISTEGAKNWVSYGPREVKRAIIHKGYCPSEEAIVDLVLKKYK